MSKTSSKTSTAAEVHTVTTLPAKRAEPTAAQVRKHDTLTETVREGMTEAAATLYRVGLALADLRELRVYQSRGFESFEDYCRAEFSLSRETVDGIIGEALTEQTLRSQRVRTLPTSRRALRALAPLRDEPEVMAEVWKSVRDDHDGAPTSAQVRDAVREVKPSTRSSVTRRASSPPGPSSEPDLYVHLTSALGAIEGDPAAVDDPSVLRVLSTLSRVLVAVRDHAGADGVLAAIHADPDALDTDQ